MLYRNIAFIPYCTQGKVELPLRDVVATADPTLAASCLAYLVAAVASEPSVNFLDFTRRCYDFPFNMRRLFPNCAMVQFFLFASEWSC